MGKKTGPKGPWKYDPETMLPLIDRMGNNGESITELAVALGVQKDTIYRWSREIPEFSVAIKGFRQRSQAWWERVGRDGMLGKFEKFNATSYIFSMKNRFPDDYADRHEFGPIGEGQRVTEIQWRVVDPESK